VREYDLIADWYSSERSGETGLSETMALASSLAPASRILDIGCGHGIPITRALLRAGHTVVGLDSSSAMLERFRQNLPQTPAIRGVARSCPFASGTFDAAIAWGVLFHLSREDQIQAIASVSRVLKIGAPFLFTSGDVDDIEGKDGVMNGVTFRYYSFSPESYRRILGEHGFAMTNVHRDNAGNTCYLATKTIDIHD